MALGPLEYVILGFPGNTFNGEIAPELGRLIDNGTIRIIDLVFINKDADGIVTAIEFDGHEDLVMYADLDGDVGGVIGQDDIDYAATDLEPSSSAALLIWEDTWAAPLVDAIRASGGVILEGSRIPQELVAEAEAALATA
jgi:hypothetical protein